MKDLRYKVVVVTGAGSGIGRALAIEAAHRGARVAVSDVNLDAARETSDLVAAIGLHDAHVSRLDVSDRDAFFAYADEVANYFGCVNVLINNAGVTVLGEFEDTTLEEFDWLLGINLGGVITGSKAFLPHLIASGDGHLVNISSLFGLITVPGQTAYSASKFAVRGFTEALRQELLIAGHPVGVTCVHPGGIKTNIITNGRATEGRDLSVLNTLFEEKMARTSADHAAKAILNAVSKRRPRALIGIDAHVVHAFGTFTGARYQDITAAVSRRFIPAKQG